MKVWTQYVRNTCTYMQCSIINGYVDANLASLDQRYNFQCNLFHTPIVIKRLHLKMTGAKISHIRLASQNVLKPHSQNVCHRGGLTKIAIIRICVTRPEESFRIMSGGNIPVNTLPWPILVFTIKYVPTWWYHLWIWIKNNNSYVARIRNLMHPLSGCCSHRLHKESCIKSSTHSRHSSHSKQTIRCKIYNQRSNTLVEYINVCCNTWACLIDIWVAMGTHIVDLFI